MATSEKELELSETVLLRSLKNVVRALETCLQLPVVNKEVLGKFAAAARTTYRNLPLIVPGRNGDFKLFLDRNLEPAQLRLMVSHAGAVDLQRVQTEFLKLEDSNPHLEVRIMETGHEGAER